ncbi:MAG TPA: hypothetical protein VGH96_09430, partial [Streptosporangiaceae bacterium]
YATPIEATAVQYHLHLHAAQTIRFLGEPATSTAQPRPQVITFIVIAAFTPPPTFRAMSGRRP